MDKVTLDFQTVFTWNITQNNYFGYFQGEGPRPFTEVYLESQTFVGNYFQNSSETEDPDLEFYNLTFSAVQVWKKILKKLFTVERFHVVLEKNGKKPTTNKQDLVMKQLDIDVDG